MVKEYMKKDFAFDKTKLWYEKIGTFYRDLKLPFFFFYTTFQRLLVNTIW